MQTELPLYGLLHFRALAATDLVGLGQNHSALALRTRQEMLQIAIPLCQSMTDIHQRQDAGQPFL